VHTFLESPAQKPFQETKLLANGCVAHLLYITQITNVIIQASLIKELKGKSFTKVGQMIFHGCKFLKRGVRPIVLTSTILDKIIKHLKEITRQRFFFWLRFFAHRFVQSIESLLYLFGRWHYVLYLKPLKD